MVTFKIRGNNNLWRFSYRCNCTERPAKLFVFYWHLFLSVRHPMRIISFELTWATRWTVIPGFEIVLAAVHLLHRSVTFQGIRLSILSSQKKRDLKYTQSHCCVSPVIISLHKELTSEAWLYWWEETAIALALRIFLLWLECGTILGVKPTIAWALLCSRLALVGFFIPFFLVPWLE